MLKLQCSKPDSSPPLRTGYEVEHNRYTAPLTVREICNSIKTVSSNKLNFEGRFKSLIVLL